MTASPSTRATRFAAFIGASVLLLTALAGCASLPPRSTAVTASSPESPVSIPVARYSRYTLVEIEPTTTQLDLLSQVIDITLPATAVTTVGDALRYVLLSSGYTLCEDRADLETLLALSLPASHFHLGPLLLRQALELLAGPAWLLDVDERARRVCFAPRETPHSGLNRTSRS